MKLFLSLSGIFGFLAVALGAMAAHKLQSKMDAHYYQIFQTGAQYQMYHALALLGVAILLKLYPESGLFIAAAWCFVGGIIIFSGSLYVLSLTETKWLGAITPIGGLSFLAGWLLLFWQAFKL